MPAEACLSDEPAARYGRGRYHADPSPEQLARFFYLSPQDIRFLAKYPVSSQSYRGLPPRRASYSPLLNERP